MSYIMVFTPEQALTRVKRGSLSIADCVSQHSVTVTNTRERQLSKAYTYSSWFQRFPRLLLNCGGGGGHQGRKHVVELSCFTVARKQQERQEGAFQYPLAGHSPVTDFISLGCTFKRLHHLPIAQETGTQTLLRESYL